jgi:hypothetical protein
VRIKGNTIVIERRGSDRRAAIVSAGYLEELEAKVRLRLPASKRKSGVWHMSGSARIIGDAATVLDQVRAHDRQLRRRKADALDLELRDEKRR